MKKENRDKNGMIMQALYKSSQKMSILAIAIIAVLEVFMMIYSVINSEHYGIYLWRYRWLYIILFLLAVIYLGLDIYVKKDLDKRYMILNVINPIYCALFFAWSLAITYSDAFILRVADPVVFMTFSLMIPLSIYLYPQVYAAVVTIADIALLILFIKINGVSAVIINLFVFFIFQYALGISFQFLRLKLAERLVDEQIKAQIDVLTGCRNRRVYAEEMKKYSADSTPEDLIYVALDINGLKETNDTYGHDCGDKLLIGAAQCMELAFGNKGDIYRIGGDEFVIFMNAKSDEMDPILSRFDSLMKKWTEDNALRLSVSYGWVAAIEYPEKDITELSLIADKRMYKCKEEYYKQLGVDRKKPE